MYNKNHISPGSSPADSINRAQYCVHVGLPDYSGGDDTARTRPGVHADCWFPAPSLVLWLLSVITSSSSSDRVTFLDHYSPCSPCQNLVYLSTHGKYLHIKKLTCIHKMWIQGVVMEHCTKTWLISMACQGHFNLYAWKINIGEHHQEISYYKRYMYYGNDWKRWFYLLHWNNLNTHLGICIWTFPIVDTDL